MGTEKQWGKSARLLAACCAVLAAVFAGACSTTFGQLPPETFAYNLVAVQNANSEQARDSFVQAVEQQDEDALYSLMLYTHIQDMEEEDLRKFSLANRIYRLYQMYYAETGQPEAVGYFIRYTAKDYQTVLVAGNYDRVFQGEDGSVIYREFFTLADNPEKAKELLLETVQGLDGNWYVKVLDEMPTDRWGQLLLPIDAGEHGQVFLQEATEETWQQLFLGAYATQQSPRNPLKAGFHTTEVFGWSELCYSFVAATSGYREGELYEAVPQYILPASELNGYLYETLDRTIHTEQINSILMHTRLLKEPYEDIELDTQTGDMILVPIAPLDRGLAVSGMEIGEKELLENGAIRVWMTYREPPKSTEGEEAGEAGEEDETDAIPGTIHELTIYRDAERTHYLSYYIYPEDAGEAKRLLTRYLAADIEQAKVQFPGDDEGYTRTRDVADQQTGWRLVQLLHTAEFGDPIPEESIDGDDLTLLYTVALGCHDMGWLDVRLFRIESSGEIMAEFFTYYLDWIPYTRGESNVSQNRNGIPFGMLSLDGEFYYYALSPAQAGQLLSGLEDVVEELKESAS